MDGSKRGWWISQALVGAVIAIVGLIAQMWIAVALGLAATLVSVLRLATARN